MFSPDNVEDDIFWVLCKSASILLYLASISYDDEKKSLFIVVLTFFALSSLYMSFV